jgi:outer membrane protein
MKRIEETGMPARKIFPGLAICIGIGAGVLLPLAARAQMAGSNVVSLGWLHVAPVQSSTPMSIAIAPAPVHAPLRLPSSFTAAGTDLRVSSTDTVGLMASHFLTDHLAVTLMAGIPPLQSVSAHGTVVPPGPAGVMAKLDIGDPALNPVIKSVRAWTPGLLMQYYFRDPDAKFRPFIGAGISYAWFSDFQMSNNFIAGLRESLGAPLAAAAGQPGETQSQIKASTSWNPLANIGFSYRVTPRFGVMASVTYMPLSTTANLYLKSAGGRTLALAKSKININPLLPYVGVTYTF